MSRPRFLQASAEAKPLRVCCYLLPPKRRIDKDHGRMISVLFAVKMTADLALACDDRVQRAFEQCEFVDRETERVTLKTKIENTHILFFALPGDKISVFGIRNATIVRLMCTRDDGQTYLYFQADVPLKHARSIGQFTDSHFGMDVFCEFAEATLLSNEEA